MNFLLAIYTWSYVDVGCSGEVSDVVKYSENVCEKLVCLKKRPVRREGSKGRHGRSDISVGLY